MTVRTSEGQHGADAQKEAEEVGITEIQLSEIIQSALTPLTSSFVTDLLLKETS